MAEISQGDISQGACREMGQSEPMTLDLQLISSVSDSASYEQTMPGKLQIGKREEFTTKNKPIKNSKFPRENCQLKGSKFC